jgi:hypothetical protein
MSQPGLTTIFPALVSRRSASFISVVKRVEPQITTIRGRLNSFFASATFTWRGDQQITSAWGANYTHSGTSYTQGGASVTLTNVSCSYDGSITAGAPYPNIGFQDTWSASDAAPTSVSRSSS